MRLSQEKMLLLSQHVVEHLWNSDLIDFKMTERELQQQLAHVLEEDLRIEDEISNEAIARIESYKRDIPYGSDEWRILYDRFFSEIATRRGYTL
jgi:uncharacterized protein